MTPKHAIRFWRGFVCLLLGGLFLYNPFLVAYGQHSAASVSHPLRHRATVGASELEQLAQPNDAAVPQPDLDVGQSFVNVATTAPAHSWRSVDRELVVPSQAGFSSSLWFRPPPAA